MKFRICCDIEAARLGNDPVPVLTLRESQKIFGARCLKKEQERHRAKHPSQDVARVWQSLRHGDRE